MTRIAIDRAFIGRALLFWLVLLWPLLIFNGPAYFEDTASYFKGGAVASRFVTDRLVLGDPTSPGHPASNVASVREAHEGNPGKADPVRDAKGVRSIPYSLFSYVLAGSDNHFMPLALVQALLVATCLTAALAAADVNRPLHVASAALILGLATPAAPVASFAMPDIFAGLTILLLALLMTTSKRYALPLLLLLIAIAIFAITAHPSHFPLAGAMVLMAGLMTIGKAIRGDRAACAMLGRTAGVLAAAAIIVVSAGYIAFGEVSIAPKRYPFLLARSVELEPARAYLQTACKTQPLEVCTIFPGELPETSIAFLWGEQGVDNVATPAQMQALRDEEPRIVLAMIRAAPFSMAEAAATGVVDQLKSFDLSGIDYRNDIKTLSPTEIAVVSVRRTTTPPIHLSQWLTLASVLLSLVAFALWLRRRNPQFVLAMMLIGGVLANAAVCSILSTVASRYQARVVWLLPLAALLLWNGRRATPRAS